MSEIIVRSISLPYRSDPDEAIAIAVKRLSPLLNGRDILSAGISRRSVDARKKNDIRFLCSVTLKTEEHIKIPDEKLKIYDSVNVLRAAEKPKPGDGKLSGRPMIVGLGPAGMFASLTLALYGYAPVVIERGKSVIERKRDTERFFKERILDENSNVQFGAGGAGTFSDGKLITRVNDPHCRAALEMLVSLGAPREILTSAKPHIGTDRLIGIVEEAEKRIKALGGDVLYETCFEALEREPYNNLRIVTSRGDFSAPLLVLSTGHSARDTYGYLIKKGFVCQPKDFSVGVRIEHLASDIDYSMYGNADISILGHAEYTLSHRRGNRGVYSFCMCPGGTVIAAASEKNTVVVNGMSYYARDLENSNSAIAVSVLKSDYGNDPLRAIEFQRQMEKAAFSLGGGDYSVPVMSVGRFSGSDMKSEISRIKPSYMGGNSYREADLTKGMPEFVVSMLREGLCDFEKKIRGFSVPDAVLSGFETRTSSPCRILRDDDFRAIGYDNVYPCGEGAGYAGGITSAAADGMRVAERIISEYAPYEKN